MGDLATQNAQKAAAALVVASAVFLYVTTERQSGQEKQQREREIETERQLSSRLAAELVAAEQNQHKFDWKATLERVVPAIVSLKLNSPKVGFWFFLGGGGIWGVGMVLRMLWVL